MAKEWYYLKVEERQGPVTTEELKGLIASGALGAEDLVWHPGAAAWVKVGWIWGLDPVPAPRPLP